MSVELRKKMGPIPSPWAKRIAREILKKFGLSQSELSITFVNNREIKSLNRKFRGVNRITDVLAFPQREGRFLKLHPPLLGDIVISVERAGTQAKFLGHSLKKEVAILMVHGVLHLLGFEDESKEKKELITRKQKQLVGWLERKKLV